jgi:hypothetical protein
VVSAFTAAGDKNSLLLEPELKVVREFHSWTTICTPTTILRSERRGRISRLIEWWNCFKTLEGWVEAQHHQRLRLSRVWSYQVEWSWFFIESQPSLSALCQQAPIYGEPITDNRSEHRKLRFETPGIEWL